MARKRMFDMEIVDTDLFLDMPQSTQNLYFHLGMRADDDGFVSNPKKIIKIIGANEDDLKLLFLKKFVIPFESGICVITHWKLNNYLRKDRYTETIYKEEKKLLVEDENGAYSLGIPNDNQLATQNRIEEKREEKKSKDKEYYSTKDLNDLFLDFLEVRKKLKAVNSERAINSLLKTLSEYDDETKYKMIEQSITNSWKGVFPLKEKKPYQQRPVREEIVPEWFGKEPKENKASKEEQKEMEDLLREFDNP